MNARSRTFAIAGTAAFIVIVIVTFAGGQCSVLGSSASTLLLLSAAFCAMFGLPASHVRTRVDAIVLAVSALACAAFMLLGISLSQRPQISPELGSWSLAIGPQPYWCVASLLNRWTRYRIPFALAYVLVNSALYGAGLSYLGNYSTQFVAPCVAVYGVALLAAIRRSGMKRGEAVSSLLYAATIFMMPIAFMAYAFVAGFGRGFCVE